MFTFCPHEPFSTLRMKTIPGRHNYPPFWKWGSWGLYPNLFGSPAHGLHPCRVPSHHIQLVLGYRTQAQGTTQDMLAGKSRTSFPALFQRSDLFMKPTFNPAGA